MGIYSHLVRQVIHPRIIFKKESLATDLKPTRIIPLSNKNGRVLCPTYRLKATLLRLVRILVGSGSMLKDLFSQELNNYILQATSPEEKLLASLRQETAQVTEFANMLTGPIEGQLLQMLVRLSKAKRCLEVGTFTGYSALRIAAGLPADGQLITCEVRAHHAQIAQKYFDQSPHGDKIQLLLGDATKTLASLNDEFDFIFIDADKANYPRYYDMLLPLLRPQGLMVVDNALWDGEVLNPQDQAAKSIHELNMKARNDPHVETVLLSVRDGILLIQKR